MVDFRQSFRKAHEKGISEAASAHLDAIRGLASIAVLLEHARYLLLQNWVDVQHKTGPLALVYAVTRFGHQAVIIFFILSGFLIGPGVLGSIHKRKWSTARYFVHRFLRLEVVLLPALLLCLFWDKLGMHLFGVVGVYHANIYPISYLIPKSISLPIFLGNAAFLQTLLVRTFGSNSSLWSLANEFWYYLLFPCVALAYFSTSKTLTRIFYGSVGILIAWFVRGPILLYFPIWVIGTAAFYLPRSNRSLLVRRGMLGLSVAVFLVVLALSQRKYQNVLVWDLILTVAFVFLLYWSLNQSTAVGTRYAKFAHGLASSSYTLYVVHLPLLVFIAVWVGQQRAPTAWKIASFIAILCGTWLYAHLVYYLFEAHTRTIRMWTEKKLKLS